MDKEIQELVIKRIETTSNDLVMSFGAQGEALTKDDMIAHVKSGDEIGQKIVQFELNYLRALKDGSIYD